MGAVTWDPKVFQTFILSDKVHLDCVLKGGQQCIAITNSPSTDLSRVVSLVKTLLKEPLPIKGDSEALLSQKGCLYFSLRGLEKEVATYNEGVESSFWITALHVILTIFTLGFFSFQEAMKLESFAGHLAETERELGLKRSEDIAPVVSKIIAGTLVHWSADEIEAFCSKGVNIGGVENLLLSKLALLDVSVVKAMVENPFFFQNMPRLVASIFQERCEVLMDEGKEPGALFYQFVGKRCRLELDPLNPLNKESPEAKFYEALGPDFQNVYNACRFVLAIVLAMRPRQPEANEDLYN